MFDGIFKMRLTDVHGNLSLLNSDKCAYIYIVDAKKYITEMDSTRANFVRSIWAR